MLDFFVNSDRREMAVFTALLAIISITSFMSGGKSVAGQSLMMMLIFPLIYFSFKINGGIFLPKPAVFFVPFLSIAAASMLWTPSLYETGYKAMLWLSYFFVFFASLRLFNTKKSEIKTKIFADCLIFLATILSLIGLYFFTTAENANNFHLISTFYWHNSFAGFLIMILPISAVVFFSKSKKPHSYYYGFSFIISALALALTYSRGAWLGMTAAIFITALAFRKSRPDFKNAGKKILISFLSVMALFMIIEYSQMEKIKRFGGISDAPAETRLENSVTARLNYFSSAVKIFKKFPVLGAGFGAFPLFHSEYQNDIRFFATDPHNFYLKILSETGVIGFAAFLLLIRGAFYNNRHLNPLSDSPALSGVIPAKNLSMGFFCGLAAALIHIAMDVDWEFSANAIIFFAMSAAMFSGRGDAPKIQFPAAPDKTAPAAVIKPALTAISLIISTAGLFIYLSDRNYREAEFFIIENDAKNAEFFLKKAISINPINPFYRRIMADFYARQAENPPENKTALFEKAEKELKISVKYNSRDPMARLILGEIYHETDRDEDAVKELMESIRIFPKENLEAHLLLAKIYQKQDKHAEIINLISELKKNYSPGLFESKIWITPDRKKTKKYLLTLLTYLKEAYEINGNREELEKIDQEIARYEKD